jgi:photosystem II stability/assembly factor-like uncharacterized protein
MRKSVYAITICILVLIGFGYFWSQGVFNEKKTHNLKPKFIEVPHGKRIVKEPKALPNEWMGYQRAYPHNEIKFDSYVSAMRQAETLHQQSQFRSEWELVGPTNIGGRITDIAVKPDDINTFYVGAASGGIFKTENGGQTWDHIFTNAASICIGDIAIDPNNHDVLYAGTGEANSSSYSFFGVGIYKSTDAGLTWEHTGLDHSAYIGRIIVDYNNSNRVFTAACGNLFSPNSERGIYRSDDGGATWENKLFVSDSTSAIDLVQHPTNPNILYASMWERIRGRTTRRSGGETSGIWKSTDGGDTWNELTNGLPNDEYVGRIGLALAESNPDVLYAFIDNQMQAGENFSFRGIWKTTNAGVSWSQTNDEYIYGINASFGWYFGQIRVDPSDEDRVFALGVDLCRTENGGLDWDIIADYGTMDMIHVDHHALYIDPDTGFMIEGNDGGLYTSDNYGNSWTKINNLPLTQYYGLEVDPRNPDRIYGGSQDNGTVRTLTGNADDWENILGGDGFHCLVNPAETNPNNESVYAEYQWGNLHKIENGYQYFLLNGEMEEDRRNWSAPISLDPFNPQTIIFGSHRVWKSTNTGNSWIAISDDLTDGDHGSSYNTLTTIATSPLLENAILVGSDDGNVHITTNNGGDWTDISAGLPDRWIKSVAFDPFNSNTIYVTVSGFRWDESTPHVFKSENLGTTWIDISSNLPELPVNKILPDTQHENRLFVGTDAGIFYSENGGQEWQSLSSNLPNVPVDAIVLHEETYTLYAGTYGCSVYKLDLNTLVDNEENDIPSANNLMKQNSHIEIYLGQNFILVAV